MTKKILFLAAGILLTLGFASFVLWKDAGTASKLSLPGDGDLRTGDLVFRRGRSLESLAVLAADPGSEFSHVGMVVVLEGRPWVIHACPGEQPSVPERLRKESVEVFLSPEEAGRFAVYRSGYSPEMLESVGRRALKFYCEGICFDEAFDLQNDQKLYCTELVYKSFTAVVPGFPEIGAEEVHFLTGRKKILMPGALIRCPVFTEVSHQFIHNQTKTKHL